uniref:tRNA (guanine(9)-N(1))-methyltransferase n=1 Tax=Anisakis simplex TaxID=6269 RepID=A0A0M3J5D4_ANISI
LKRQRYLEKRQEKRILEKARKKAKRDEIRKTGGDLAPRRGPITLMSESTCEQRIAIDLCYESKMNERQIKSIITQLSFCYAANRRVRNPSQLYFLSFGGVTRGMFNSNPTYSNWDIHFETKSLCEVFKKDDIVYLTADSENILENLDSSRVYVIGGLLDHNSLKGYCLNEANEMGVAHARLPIDDFFFIICYCCCYVLFIIIIYYYCCYYLL